MKKHILFLSIITLGLLNQVSFSQEVNLNIDTLKSQIEKVPYIFKGEVIDVQFYLGDEYGNKLPDGTFYLPNGKLGIGYSSAKIQICQILKGEDKLIPGTIEIITSSPNQMQPNLYINDKGETAIGWLRGNFCSGCINPPFIESKYSAIFFCEEAKYKGATRFVFDNSLGVYLSSNVGIIGINTTWMGYKMSLEEYKEFYDSEINRENSNRENITYAGWYGKRFYYPDDLSVLLNKQFNLNTSAIDFCKKKYLLPENKDSIEQIKIQNKIRYEQNVKNYNKNMEQMIKLHNIDTTKTFEEWKNDRQNNNIQKKTNGTKSIDLSLEIANSKLTGTSLSDAYMEFDVMISSYASVYLSGCLLRISYNTSAFGSNVVAGNNITITRGNSFDIPTYTDPNVDKADWSNSVIGIPFNDDLNQTTFNRPLLSSFPEVLMHIKIKIQSNGCDKYANIEFADIAFTPMFSYYTLTPDAAILDGIIFDNTYYSTGIYDKTCMPVISNFTNDIPAGNGSILTITGKYFGATKGTGTVIFRDANQGNVYPQTATLEYIGIDNYDTISWSDNEIVIKLPSVLDQIASFGIPVKTAYPVPGSGIFKVANFTTEEIETNTPLIIPYALYQYPDLFPIYQKVNVYLSNQNDSGGYSIRCNSSMLSTFPNAKTVINRAIKDWNCATLVNWRLGADTTTLGANDGVCTIYTASLPGTALMSTSHEIYPCNYSSPRKYYLISFDIVINNPGVNWQIDTSGPLQSGYYDFYHAIAHELGHGLLLYHANPQGEIMFHGADIGPYPANQRVLVWNSPGAMDGGYYETGNFSSALPTCTNEHSLYSAPQYCTGLSIHDGQINDIDIVCYPNPIESGNLSIQIDLKKNTFVYYKLYNSIGQIIKTSQSEQYNGRVTITIPTDDLYSGFYYMQVYLNNRFKTVKWIKM